MLGAVDYLLARGMAPAGVGVLGASIGASAALLAAAEEPAIRAVVADSPRGHVHMAAPHLAGAWFGPLVRWMGRAATLDPRPGGIYRCDINGKNIARGEYLEVVPFSKIVFSFGWEGGDTPAPGQSTVEILLTPDGDGTHLRLRHHGLDPAERSSHGEGWDHFLPRLVSYVDRLVSAR